ncbi:MAG TPA: hypothetical protein VFF03_08120 [Rhodocyclaceae bacterium]|nr:hypothetical protein [Rhodocyclaceae bacterium]
MNDEYSNDTFGREGFSNEVAAMAHIGERVVATAPSKRWAAMPP